MLQKSNLLQSNQKAQISSKVRRKVEICLVSSSNPPSTAQINPAILGGLIIEVGDKTIDLSVSSKINKLNRLLSEAI